MNPLSSASGNHLSSGSTLVVVLHDAIVKQHEVILHSEFELDCGPAEQFVIASAVRAKQILLQIRLNTEH